ncbi:unnamed protein product [Adineta ricciae]|uniref:Uncharacterized protein n=1 Tax=Adineta ricciae TaxID=249248 RepID=A0A815L447_ADIRI|nr:unnamed protein product [Adineta ricciae]
MRRGSSISYIKYLKTLQTSSSYQVEDGSTLDYDDSFDDIEVDEENDPTFDGSENEEDRDDDATGKRKRTWKSVQDRFRRSRHKRYLGRFRKYLEDHGTKKQKIDDIDTFVFERFVASKYWITTFKHRHGIVSRKIMLFVTKHVLDDAEEIEQAAARFLELHCTRTLSCESEKLTMAAVKSKNAITHSCTVQPVINQADEVVGPIYLYFKEPDEWICESEFANMFFRLQFELS